MLAFNNLEKRFDYVIAVNDVTLEIPHGQMIGVIGRSGVIVFQAITILFERI